MFEQTVDLKTNLKISLIAFEDFKEFMHGLIHRLIEVKL